MMGYMLGGFFLGLIVGIAAVVVSLVIYFKKLRPKFEALVLKLELERINKDNKENKK